ncbi:unnamed protein product [Larinioides sclopetarius]|uniref:Uncharacterized protein n=1 Tax=Larinioides sclopetarius TaxID=280406 RepID=A0AAV1ZFF8_9ARAC
MHTMLSSALDASWNLQDLFQMLKITHNDSFASWEPS